MKFGIVSTRAISLSFLFFLLGFAPSVWADDPPNPSADALQTDVDTPLTFALDDDAQLVGTPETDGVPTEEDGRILEDGDNFVYTPADDFEGLDSFDYEICHTDGGGNPSCDEPITATIQVGELGVEVNGPQEGSTHSLTPDEDGNAEISVHGNTGEFKTVRIYLDDEEVGSSNADGKGAWTYTLAFNIETHEAGDYVIDVEDENGNRTQVTVTIEWDEDGDDNGGGGLPGRDPEVGSTGGRAGSCASMQGAPSTGLVILAGLMGLAWMRRRQER